MHVLGTDLGQNFTFEYAGNWPPIVMVVCTEMLVADIVLFLNPLQKFWRLLVRRLIVDITGCLISLCIHPDGPSHPVVGAH